MINTPRGPQMLPNYPNQQQQQFMMRGGPGGAGPRGWGMVRGGQYPPGAGGPGQGSALIAQLTQPPTGMGPQFQQMNQQNPNMMQQQQMQQQQMTQHHQLVQQVQVTQAVDQMGNVITLQPGEQLPQGVQLSQTTIQVPILTQPFTQAGLGQMISVPPPQLGMPPPQLMQQQPPPGQQLQITTSQPPPQVSLPPPGLHTAPAPPHLQYIQQVIQHPPPTIQHQQILTSQPPPLLTQHSPQQSGTTLSQQQQQQQLDLVPTNIKTPNFALLHV
uniref:Uncharacterized protein n=1 Tax=Cacopsylla melanoneura TaxID=428564 RepID=A0A8D8WI24_9HEMI